MMYDKCVLAMHVSSMYFSLQHDIVDICFLIGRVPIQIFVV